MKENIVQKLTSKDDKYACAFTDRIVAESHDTDQYNDDILGAIFRKPPDGGAKRVEE